MTWAHVSAAESRLIWEGINLVPFNFVTKSEKIKWTKKVGIFESKIEKVTNKVFILKNWEKKGEKISIRLPLPLFILCLIFCTITACYDEFRVVPVFNFSIWYLLQCPLINLLMQVKSLFFGFVYLFHGSWQVVLQGHGAGEIWASCSFPHSCLPS